MRAQLLILFILLFSFSNFSAAATRLEKRVRNANSVLMEVMQIPEKRIPPQLLSNAQALVIIPHRWKVGFVLGGQYGRGLMLVRGEDQRWRNPVFVKLTGGSIGLQAGAQTTDIVLVFKNLRGIDGIEHGKWTLGGDISVAAGPVGREASAYTDRQLRAEVFSYARSRGLFAGVALDGAVIQIDKRANRNFYQQRDIESVDVLSMDYLPPHPADTLLSTVEFYAPAPRARGPYESQTSAQELRRADIAPLEPRNNETSRYPQALPPTQATQNRQQSTAARPEPNQRRRYYSEPSAATANSQNRDSTLSWRSEPAPTSPVSQQANPSLPQQVTTDTSAPRYYGPNN